MLEMLDATRAQLSEAEIQKLTLLKPTWKLDGLHDSLAGDLSAVDRIQKKFDADLGIVSDGEALIRSYNPVLARWKFEQLKTEEERQAFRAYELQQIQTNLRERYRTETSTFSYRIDQNGKLRNELLPDEVFEHVIMRGIVYRRQQGSPELEREEQELTGFRKVQRFLADKETPVGAKAIAISPPGIVKGTTYKDNFVDVYEAAQDDGGERAVKVTRYTSGLGYEAYGEVAARMDPAYFTETELPIDAWYISHPFFITDALRQDADEVFASLFAIDPRAMAADDFQKYINEASLPNQEYLRDKICEKYFDGSGTALAHNALLNIADHLYEQFKQFKAGVIDKIDEIGVFTDARMQAVRWGTKEVAEISAGCGTSSGFSVAKGLVQILGNEQLAKLLSNSVAKYGIKTSDDEESEWFNCPKKACGYKATGPVGDSCPGCGLTKEQFAKEGGEVC